MDRTYKGYLISKSLNGNWWIMKDGKRISTASTIKDAKETINAIPEAA